MPGERESKSSKAMAVWPDQPPEFSRVPLPDRLLVPLGAAGAEAKAPPSGTVVHRGQVLVDRAPESSHLPVAPADGVLGHVRPIRLTNGRPAVAVELVVDRAGPGNFKEDIKDSDGRQADSSGLVAWIERLRRAGVWADRQSSPDLIGQLNQVVSRPIDTVACTALDSDASLRLNGAIAARFNERVAEGTALLARMTGAGRAVLAVEEDANPAWAGPWRAAARAAKLELVEMANDYPQSDPTLMVYSLTRRRLRPGHLPTTRGVLMVDAATARAVGQAALGTAMLSSLVAIHDYPRRRSHYLDVAVGTPLREVLDPLSIGGEGLIVRGGDLLRDRRLRTDAVIGGGELTIHATGPQRVVIPEPCIRCAWCAEACPTLVHPASVLDAAQRNDARLADRAGIGACIECGLCSHVCPSQLPLLEAIREIRKWA
ncbi:MAG TPA: 4Fe-4S dicluster domain-containing protein [Tepidisphaeraceae bacterium]|nr:4Fe-4S dicluster domain-containing protein [Tepidisphaeraceae bacterium]